MTQNITPVREETVIALLLQRIEEKKECTREWKTELRETETLLPDNACFSGIQPYDSDIPHIDPGFFFMVKDGKIEMVAYTVDGVDAVLDMCDEIDAAPEDSFLGTIKTSRVSKVERDKLAVERDKEEIKAAKIDRFIKLQDFYFRRLCALGIIGVGLWLLVHDRLPEGICLTLFGCVIGKVFGGGILSLFSKIFHR